MTYDVVIIESGVIYAGAAYPLMNDLSMSLAVIAWDPRFTDLMWPGFVAHLPAFDSLRIDCYCAGVHDVNTFDGIATNPSSSMRAD